MRSPLARSVAPLGLVLAVASFGLGGRQVNDYLNTRETDRDVARAAMVEQTSEAAARVNGLLLEMERVVDGLSTELTAGMYDHGLAEQLKAARAGTVAFAHPSCNPDADDVLFEAALCAATAAIPELNGLGVAFAAAEDPDSRYLPYANRIDGRLDLGALSADVVRERDWYVSAAARAAESGSPLGSWVTPRFGQTSQKLLAFYSAPFFNPDGSVRGVILATYALDRLADDLRSLSVGSAGYSVILSDTGQLVSHPVEGRVIAEFDGGDRRSASGIVAALRDGLARGVDGEQFVGELEDEVTGAAAWLAVAPIQAIDWSYGAVVVEQEVFKRTVEDNRMLINAGLAVLLGLLLVGVSVVSALRLNLVSLWALSTFCAALAVAGVGWIWFITISGPGDMASSRDVPAESAAELSRDSGEEPLYAGVFVQSVEFTGANDVTVSGIVWQQQRSDESRSELPGFVFPEADEVSLEKQYEVTSGNVTRVGWSFTASLRQTFDYSRYPLDRETVWLRLWPGDYSSSLLMLPDLTSYETLAPTTRPGIEQDFVVEGWVLDSSSFSYRDNEYNTDFGLRDLANDTTPEMYFNVGLKRSFIDSLMSQLVPLTVVAMLLFCVLLITGRKDTVTNSLDFSSLGVLSYCAALFFVVILSHTELRSKLKAQEVIYLEYFYFAAYIAILAVSANAIFVGMGREGPKVLGRQNLVPTLLFWPILNVALLVVTILSFY